jgi:hypothetical protein
MDIKTAKAIPIDQFLQRLGHEPAKLINGCQWYRSPTRNEKTPSFKLTPDTTAWYDHGTGEGGNILDLAYRIHSGLPLTAKLAGEQLNQALTFIENAMGLTSYVTLPRQPAPSATAEPHAFTLLEHTPFAVYTRGSSLTQTALYLGSRGVNPERVAPYLEDVTFSGRDGKKRYGFGVPNVSGGYEIRRDGDWEKRSVGTKDVTMFKSQHEDAPWHTFYSLIDFCTFITVDRPPIGAYHFLIINSDSLVDKAMGYLAGIPQGFMIHYPHADASGQRAYHKVADFLTRQGWVCGNKADLYAGFNDWTEAREYQLGLRSLATKGSLATRVTGL